MPDLGGKKALMIIASSNFRDEEYNEPRRILEGAGVKITVASSSLEVAKGMLGGSAKPDILISQVDVSDYDAILFIGGSGASEYWNDPTTHTIAKEAVKQGKVLGAICIAPTTLANAGVLTGKKVTAFSSEVAKLRSKGANYTGADVEIDGRIITASGPGAAVKFGQKIVQALTE